MSASGAEAGPAPTVGLAAGRGVWVILPTYNERENLEPMAAAILRSLPEGSLLVVDDNSPDGTGAIADTLAAAEPRISVLHRPGKEGLGAAYREAFAWALERPYDVIVQMDCDLSHDPAAIPELLDAVAGGAHCAIGSRYVPGGSTPNWPLHRRLSSVAHCLPLPGRGEGERDAWR